MSPKSEFQRYVVASQPTKTYQPDRDEEAEPRTIGRLSQPSTARKIRQQTYSVIAIGVDRRSPFTK